MREVFCDVEVEEVEDQESTVGPSCTSSHAANQPKRGRKPDHVVEENFEYTVITLRLANASAESANTAAMLNQAWDPTGPHCVNA